MSMNDGILKANRVKYLCNIEAFCKIHKKVCTICTDKDVDYHDISGVHNVYLQYQLNS